MPKKTKKEKLKVKHVQAKVNPAQEVSSDAELPMAHPPMSTFTFKRTTSTPHIETVKTKELSHTDIYLRRDLLKTVVLALIAVAILIVLSFYTR